MAFSQKPRPKAVDGAAAWVAKAAVGAAKTPEVTDKNGKATKTFNLRLNEYELDLLREVAKSEYCSQQALAKRLLVRALESLREQAK